MKQLLRLENVNVFYGDLQALWDINFEVGEGEIVSLIGSNGAGKSTILQTISGLLHPKSGKIEFLGKRIDHKPIHQIVKTGLSLVPEGRRLFPSMTVYENLTLGSYLLKKKEREKNLKWTLKVFPVLSERKTQLAGTLSGGEQQMLAMARALVGKPKLYLLDEPSQGLAPLFIRKIIEIVREINREGVAVLLVEQNCHQALEISERAYVLESGRIVAHGTGKELLKDDRIKKAYLGM